MTVTTSTRFPSNSFAPQRIACPLLLRALFSAIALVALSAVSELWILVPSAAYGQVVTALLQGTVKDLSGAAITKAQVAVTNTSTGITTSGETDANGRFVFPSLLPGGPYSLKVEATGFKSEVQSGIHLEVNQEAEVDVVLQVGATSQQVEVNADATQLETTEAAMGQVIGNQQITDLPLNERNIFQLMYLVPGTTGNVSFAYNGLVLSVNGGNPGTTSLLVDGIPASPGLVNPLSGFSVYPSVDAVQEFKMMSNSYSAEFGRSGSGIVNVILKSGTNEVHGSAYEFLRNSALDANSFFDKQTSPVTPLPLFHRSQFGATLTGPVYLPKLYNGRNKTFFLFSYEGLREGTFGTETVTVPTALQAAGDFSQTYNSSGELVQIYDPTTTTGNSTTGYTRTTFTSEYNEGPGNSLCGGDINCIPPSRIDPVAANVIKYYPPPNQQGQITGANNWYGAGVTIENINNIDTRVDETINDHNRLFVSYSQHNEQNPPTLYFPKQYQIAEGGNTEPQIGHTAAIDYTHDFGPNFVMEIPFGFSRMAINYVPISEGFNPTTLGFPSYIAANADHLLFPGIGAANYYTLGDSADGEGRHSGFDTFMFGVRNSKVLNSHMISFGGEARWYQVNDIESGDSTGNFFFDQGITQGPDPLTATSTAGNGIASLLLGVGSSIPGQASEAAAGATNQMDINSKTASTTSRYFALYLQDDWKVLPKLGLNLGVRYDLDIPRTERFNRMTSWDATEATPLAAETGLTGMTGGVVFAGVDGNSRRQFNPQWKNFSPRVGLSYEVDRKTVVRTSYGIYYLASIRAASATIGNEGFGSVTNYIGSNDGLTPSVYLSNPFPNGLNLPTGSSAGALTGIGSSFELPPVGDNKVGYTQDWELDIQRELPYDILIDAAYVGTHAVHLNKASDWDWNGDQLTPAALALGNQLVNSVPNPFYGIIKTGPESSPTITESYLEAPFPQFVALDGLEFLSGGYKDYNSFQLKVNKRVSHGLIFLVSFTGQKLIDDYDGIETGNDTGELQNIYDEKAEHGLSTNDISRSLVVSGVYSLPFGRGQRFGSSWNRSVNAVLGGWQLNGISTEQNGFPLSVTAQNTSDSGNANERANAVPGVKAAVGGPVKNKLNDYVNPAAFSQPAPFTFGDTPRGLGNLQRPRHPRHRFRRIQEL